MHRVDVDYDEYAEAYEDDDGADVEGDYGLCIHASKKQSVEANVASGPSMVMMMRMMMRVALMSGREHSEANFPDVVTCTL